MHPLRQAREARGLSLRQLSLLSRVNKSAIIMIEQGRRRWPREKTLKRLARVLLCEVVDLRQARNGNDEEATNG